MFPRFATEVTSLSALWDYATGTPFRGNMFAFTPAQLVQERIPFLAGATDVIYNHHERFDGDGYPRGLAGDDIPLVRGSALLAYQKPDDPKSTACIVELLDALDAYVAK